MMDDLLSRALHHVRQHLDRRLPLRERLLNYWAAVAAASDLGSTDVVDREFITLAAEAGLLADLGRHGHDDILHVIRWARRGLDPFGGNQ
jgi:hypothetical protein